MLSLSSSEHKDSLNIYMINEVLIDVTIMYSQNNDVPNSLPFCSENPESLQYCSLEHIHKVVLDMHMQAWNSHYIRVIYCTLKKQKKLLTVVERSPHLTSSLHVFLSTWTFPWSFVSGYFEVDLCVVSFRKIAANSTFSRHVFHVALNWTWARNPANITESGTGFD